MAGEMGLKDVVYILLVNAANNNSAATRESAPRRLLQKGARFYTFAIST